MKDKQSRAVEWESQFYRERLVKHINPPRQTQYDIAKYHIEKAAQEVSDKKDAQRRKK